MGTHGVAGTRPRALPPGNRGAESTKVSSSGRRPLLNLSNWPVSRRLFAVILAAVLMGVVFGGLRVADAEASAAQFSRTSQFANLGDELVVLVNDLQNERDATLTDLTNDSTPPASLQALFGTTDAEAAAVREAAAPISSGFPANIQADVSTVLADISPSRLAQLHNTINPTLPANELAAIANYGVAVGDIINLADQVSQGVSDASLASNVRALNALALAKEQVSQQRALLNDAFFNPNDLSNTTTALPIAEAEQASDESAFQQSATPAEQSVLADALGAPGVPLQLSMAQNIESNIVTASGAPADGSPVTVLDDLQALQGDLSAAQTATTLANAPKGQKAGPIGAKPTGTAPTSDKQGAAAWDKGIGDQIAAMESTESQIAGNIVTRANQLHSSAQQTALLFGIITALVLLIVLLAALVVARSLVLPLRRLRAGALNIASVQLPERVRLLSESPDAAATMEVAPINVVSDDEIGQVARAFDQVHAEAVRLAGEQALLRSSFNAMFVNLSRRSQSLIERLARTIDTLEQSEDDPDRLGSLFTMDHMVTRMRRNSENLLLLAGHENPRKWSESIPLADVARAATSEIEQYNRVTLNVPPGIAVVGPAVSDVVHLIAELLENATIFSPKDTQVHLSMQELTSGGVLIEVLDQGIGVSDVRLADMNFRLDNPPTIDVSVSRHMGLFAVARLAERHRVRVRLRPATPQGLSALVWLPDSAIERTSRYGSVHSWSTQSAGVQATVGARSGGSDMALDDGGTASLAQGGYGGNGGNGGNGGYGGNGNSASAAREARTASGWFRGQVARGPAPSAPAPGAPAPGAPAPGAPAAPDWGARRVPGESLAGSSFDQTSAGLPVRTPSRGGGQSPATPGVPGGSQSGAGGGQSRAGGTGSQGLPSRGGDSGWPTPSRGQIPRGPGGGNHALPQRSPEQARSRLAGFQRGTRRAEEQPGADGQSGMRGQPGQYGQPGAGEGSER